MLVIRTPQRNALIKSRLPLLRTRLAAHAAQFFPVETAKLEARELAAVLERATDRPRRYGFKTECDAAKWLNLMFTFGRNFDTDPRLGWASELLARVGDTDDRRPMIDRLFLAALEHIHEARGIHGA